MLICNTKLLCTFFLLHKFCRKILRPKVCILIIKHLSWNSLQIKDFPNITFLPVSTCYPKKISSASMNQVLLLVLSLVGPPPLARGSCVINRLTPPPPPKCIKQYMNSPLNYHVSNMSSCPFHLRVGGHTFLFTDWRNLFFILLSPLTTTFPSHLKTPEKAVMS